MYKLDRTNKQLTKLASTTLTDQGLLERFDLEEWRSSSLRRTTSGVPVVRTGSDSASPHGTVQR